LNTTPLTEALENAPKTPLQPIHDRLDVHDDLLVTLENTVRALARQIRCEGATPPAASIHIEQRENPDNITIGTPGTGQVSVYGDCSRQTEFAEKIKIALELLAAAQEKKRQVAP
jgi:hypothetical protein